MLTVVSYDENKHSFYARLIKADVSSGEMVFHGKISDDEIRENANYVLAAPPCGDFSDAKVEWE